QPCLSALLPSMVPADDLPRATALSQTAGSLGMMLAPVLGGLLMGRFGLRVPLLADAGSYLAIAAAGRLIRTRRGVAPRPPGPALSDVDVTPTSLEQHGCGTDAARDGWTVRKDPLVRAAVTLVGAVVAAASLVNVAEVFFIRSTLHSTAGMYGLMGSLWISASVAGGWWVARRRPSDPGLAVLLLGSLAVTCLGVALMAAVPAVGWLAPVNVLGGLGNGGLNVAAAVLLGRRAPAALRGRVFAMFGAAANAATVVGYVLGGVLLALISARVTIAAAGLGGLLVTAAFTLPVLRATARERGGLDNRTDGWRRIGTGRPAGAAGAGRPLR
ncbi:MAG: MFS transporter, partial [Streptosporangiaceae bacterium]